MPDLVPVRRDLHATQLWRRFDSFAFVHQHPCIPVVLDEHETLAATLPLVLLPDDTGLQLMALTRLGARSALVAPSGVWRGMSIPALLRVYPFRSSAPDATGQVSLLVDQSSGLIAPRDAVAQDAGWEPFFTPTGELVPALAQIVAYFRTRALAERQMRGAVAALVQAGVVTKIPPYPDLPVPEGSLWIEPAALAALGRTDLAQLHRAGALALAHSLLVARHHVPFLAQAEAALTRSGTEARATPQPGAAQDADLASFLEALAAARGRDVQGP